jgi:MFS family permease
VLVMRVGGLLAGLGLAIGLGAPNTAVALAAFVLLGLGLAPIVPIAFSAAGSFGPRALGWVVTMSYVGSVLGPAAIGLIAHTVGLRAGLAIPAALAVAAAALAPFARTAAGAVAGPEPPLV